MDWAYDPMTQSEDANIRGRSTKSVMKMVLKEEMKVIYGGPKSFRGERSPRKHLSEVVWNLPILMNTTLRWPYEGEFDIG